MKLFAALTLSLATLTAPAAAQDYPDRPIAIVNPYAAGGPADLIGRTLAEAIGKILGQPVVVENRTGAATAVAGNYVAAAAPDGYTLLLAGSPTHVITPALQTVNYDGVKSFALVSMVVNVPNVLVVNAKSGIKTAQELADKAKSAPDAVSFASVGNGSLPHLSSVLFGQRVDAQMVHIPYQGAAPAVVDLLAGNVDMGFLNAPPLMQHFQSGDLVALGIAASARSKQLPDVPTMEELGFGQFEMSTWYGISAPAGTPADVIAKLDDAISQAMQTPEVQERLTKAGIELFYKPTAEFGPYLAADAERMIQLLDAAGVKKQ